MKKTILLSIIILTSFLSLSFAQEYTTEEVAKHNTPDDCWMIFENKVHDFSGKHLNDHEKKYMNIEDWCGEDMTEDFQTKAGEGKDHSGRVYVDLENYYIGELTTNDQSSNSTSSADGSTPLTMTASKENPKPTTQNPYNFWLPALIAGSAYMLYWFAMKSNKNPKLKLLNKNTFNFTFNTVMFLGLIPSAIFGLIMIAAYSYSSIRDVDFDFLYWHVELSVAFATLILAHFLTRFKLYKAPLRLFRKKSPTHKDNS